MKASSFFIMSLLAMTISLTAAQTNAAKKSESAASKSKIHQVEVIPPKVKPYVIDLARKQTVYRISADTDPSLVRVRTEVPLSMIVREAHLRGSDILIGSAEYLSQIGFGFPPGSSEPPTMEAKCNGLVCGCTGTKDCNDLKKKYKGQDFFCGTMDANAPEGPASSYGRKPGTSGCITEDPSHD